MRLSFFNSLPPSIRKAILSIVLIVMLPTPVWAANQGAVERTKLVIPVRDPAQSLNFPDITPDGRYLLVTRSKDQTTWLVSMDGHRYKVPGRGLAIFGSTPQGDVIFRYPAGAAPLAFVFRPGKGIVKRFPGKADKFAAATHFAAESKLGHWVECMSNVSGGDPVKEIWYDIDGHTVPLLQRAQQVAWSPNGVDLAALIGSPGDASLWLAVYHTKTQKREVDMSPVPMPDDSGLGLPTPVWSPDGQVIAVQSSKGIAVYDTVTKHSSSIDADLHGAFWGWTTGGRLYILRPDANGNGTVQYYDVHNGAAAPSNAIRLPFAVHDTNNTEDGRILVKSSAGGIYLIDGPHVTTLVKKGADRWWYDTANGYVYFGVRKHTEDSGEPVYRVKVP
jgi:WD40 repeat protein